MSRVGRCLASTDLRLTRRLFLGDRVKVELMAESFDLLNRDNKRPGHAEWFHKQLDPVRSNH